MKKVRESQVSINLYKPENLVLEDLIKPELPYFVPVRKDDGSCNHKMIEGKNLMKHIPSIYYFVHVLLERQHSDVEILRCRFAKDYIEMFSRDIEPLKSKNDFRFIWGILTSHKIIEYHDDNKPNQYRNSAKAYYFKFSEKYANSVVVQHQVSVRQSIADKLNKRWSNVRNAALDDVNITALSTNKQLAHQYRTLRNIRFDSDGAKLHIDKLLVEKVIDSNQFNTFQLSINNIKNGRIRIKKSEVCNRFFTTVSDMPKELRPFIRDSEGNSLVELDFGSFNAFAVYRILNTINPDYKTNAQKIGYENELDLYRRILSGGDFYSDFKSQFFNDADLNRDEIKNIVLKFWFNGRMNSRNKYRLLMLKRMPRISDIIDSLKVEKYENFSNTAMKMESELVNDIIYKKFVDTYPDVIMYTIFDSFLVEQKYSAQLQSMMLEEGSKYFNINCIVRAK